MEVLAVTPLETMMSLFRSVSQYLTSTFTSAEASVLIAAAERKTIRATRIFFTPYLLKDNANSSLSLI
jgi:hypothetical protein